MDKYKRCIKVFIVRLKVDDIMQNTTFPRPELMRGVIKLKVYNTYFVKLTSIDSEVIDGSDGRAFVRLGRCQENTWRWWKGSKSHWTSTEGKWQGFD